MMGNKGTNIVVLIIIVLIIFFAFVVIIELQMNGSIKETMVNINPVTREIKWAQDKTCPYKIPTVITNILNNNNINETQNDDWTIYIPCTYNNIALEISKIKPSRLDQRIFIVNNAEQFGGKNLLWKNLVETYGREQALLLAPPTYILNDINELRIFNKEYDNNKLYILKKNIQRQEGLKITNDKKEILKGSKEGYVIVQELLQNPYLINGRKINMRFYLLLVCQNNEISAYVHNDGFMYYTKMGFEKNSLEKGPNITTGYIERWVYDVNPLTHNDFREYLDNSSRQKTSAEEQILAKNEKISQVVFHRINELLAKCVKAIKHTVCMGSHIKKFISFQLFGIDIAIDETLEAMIIEANLGPSIEPFDARDSIVKHKVMNDILKVLKIIPDKDNGYVKIYN